MDLGLRGSGHGEGDRRTLLLTTEHLPEQEALPTGPSPLLHMCTHTHTHTRAHAMYTDLCGHAQARTHTREYVHMYTHTSRHATRMLTHMHTCRCSCGHVHVLTHTPVQRCSWTHIHNTRVHVHACVCLHTLMHMLTHTCVHTHSRACALTQVHPFFKMANYCCFLKRIHPTMVGQGASSPGQGSSVDTPPLGGLAAPRNGALQGLLHTWPRLSPGTSVPGATRRNVAQDQT